MCVYVKEMMPHARILNSDTEAGEEYQTGYVSSYGFWLSDTSSLIW